MGLECPRPGTETRQRTPVILRRAASAFHDSRTGELSVTPRPSDPRKEGHSGLDTSAKAARCASEGTAFRNSRRLCIALLAISSHYLAITFVIQLSFPCRLRSSSRGCRVILCRRLYGPRPNDFSPWETPTQESTIW